MEKDEMIILMTLVFSFIIAAGAAGGIMFAFGAFNSGDYLWALGYLVFGVLASVFGFGLVNQTFGKKTPIVKLPNK